MLDYRFDNQAFLCFTPSVFLENAAGFSPLQSVKYVFYNVLKVK